MVICLVRDADLQTSWCNLYSLSLASVKSRLVLPFWYRLTWVVPEKGPLNGCVCVFVCVSLEYVPRRLCPSSHDCATLPGDATGRRRENTWGPIYKISYDLSHDYRKFIVRSTYDSDLQRKLIYEHYLRRSYDFASELYPRKALFICLVN